jgi:tetratricopeptide (TPR) repeat protein
MSRHLRFVLLVVTVATAATILRSPAQTAANNPCNQYGKPDEVITACTNFIQGRKLWNGQPAKALNLSGMLTIRAGAYTKLGQHDRALADHNESVKLSPKVAFPVSMRGGFYYDRGAYDEAMSDVNQTLRIDPKFTDALLNRGAIYLFRGDVARANADFAAAIRINPSLQTDVRRKELNIHWLRYLKEIQDERDYANWSGPPLEAYRNAPR